MKCSYKFRLIAAACFVALAAIVSSQPFVAMADDIQDWQTLVAKRIAKAHIYPRSAQLREVEGAAKVQVTISRTGEILKSEVIEPSGIQVLDKAIPRMMKKINPLPAPPAGLPDDGLTFVVPIVWRLK